jgi:uncharacterized integral membrane protein
VREDDGERRGQREGSPEGEREAAREEREHRHELLRERRRRGGKTIAALAIVVVLILFVLDNARSVAVSFLVFDGRTPLIWVMVACAVLGGIVGFLLGRPGRTFRFHRGDDRHAKERRRDRDR